MYKAHIFGKMESVGMGSRTGDDFEGACHFVHELLGRAHDAEIFSAYVGPRPQGEFWHGDVMIFSIVMLILLCNDNGLLECLVNSFQGQG